MAAMPSDFRSEIVYEGRYVSRWRYWSERLYQSWLAPFRGVWHSRAQLRPSSFHVADESGLMLRAGATSIKGDCRKTNQDRCYCDCGLGVFMVADGMGGRVGGEEASRIAVERIPWYLALTLPQGPTEFSLVKAAVENSVRDARAAMSDYAAVHQDCLKMGTTLAMSIVIDDVLYVGHAGDCRVYHFRDNSLRRLTCDHSLVRSMVDAGIISEAEAEQHPWRHRVVNWVGVESSGQPPEVTALRLRPGDRFLLTSDGLTSVVDDDRIRYLLSSERDPQRAAQQLVGQAVVNQSCDNVSCVVVDYVAVPEESKTPWQNRLPQLQPVAA